MADSKSVGSKDKSTKAPPKVASKPAAPKIPARKVGSDPNAPKLVKKEAPKPEATATTAKGSAEAPEYHPMLDPDRLGRMLHFRPAWVDELFAIMLVVLGIVSLLS